MNAKKCLTMLMSAALAVTTLAGCGGSNDFSREAVKAANEAQSSVTFETDATLTKALRNALKDNTQTNDIKLAVEADESMEGLLTTGYDLDVHAVAAENKDAAADAIAQLIVQNDISGKKSEGKLAMAQHDGNNYYYAAVLTYVSSGSGSGEGEKPAPEEKFTLDSIDVSAPTKVEYWDGEELDTIGMTVTANYKGDQGNTKEEPIEPNACEITPTALANDSEENSSVTITVTYEGKTDTFTVTVKPVVLEKIQILGYKNQYKSGEFFLFTGGTYNRVPREELTLKLIYNNGKTEELKLTEEMVREGGSLVSSPTMFFITGTRNVVVTYTVDGKEYKTEPMVVTVVD